MRNVLIAAFGLILIVGCNLPQTYIIDVAKVEGCEAFDWDGRVTVKESHKGIFTGYTVDIIKLEAKDGRAMLLETRWGKGIDAYVKVEGKTCRPKTDESTEVRQRQDSPD